MQVQHLGGFELPSPKLKTIRKPILTDRTTSELHFDGPATHSARSGKSHNSNRSRFRDSIGTLMKSSLYEAVRSRQKGETESELRDRNAQLGLLTESMELQNREEERMRGEMGDQMIRWQRQGIHILQQLKQ